MSDRYATFANSGPGRAIVTRLGLPNPPRLRRHRPGDPVVTGPVLVGGDGRLAEPVRTVLHAVGAEVAGATGTASTVGAASSVDGSGADGADATPDGADAESGATGEPGAVDTVDEPGSRASGGTAPRTAALVFDATGITDTAGLRGLYDFFHPVARSLRPSGRVIVLGTPPESTGSPGEAAAQRALEGFVRSLGKELGRGSTAQLVQVAPGAEDAVESTLRFLLSARSAYVSGQVVRVTPGTGAPADWAAPLAGKVALVTGAAQGIGAAIARVLARDRAHVVCLDVPAAGDALSTVANDVGGTALQLDLTAVDAAQRLADFVAARFGTVDVVVHNAGITRDKTVARMKPESWDAVLDVNLSSQQRINDTLLERDLIPSGGRIIAVSSVSGIAGNRGQTNYATSKAGVIGLVQSMAPGLRERGITVNAVAPGFIETKMTAAMPLMIREAGRRMNSMAQGGLPVDVAETVAWFASPGSAGVTGNVVRVCGQSLLGA